MVAYDYELKIQISYLMRGRLPELTQQDDKIFI